MKIAQLIILKKATEYNQEFTKNKLKMRNQLVEKNQLLCFGALTL